MGASKARTRAAGKIIVTVAAFWVIICTADLYGAESAEVSTSDGKIAGVVRIEGPLPKLEPPKINKDQDVCKDVPNESLMVGPGNGLQNVVVTVKGVPALTTAARPSPRPVYRLTNLGCRFIPHVMVMQSNNDLEIDNDDPILHTARVARAQVSLGLYPGRAIQSGIGGPALGPMRLTCDLHRWMLGYVFLTDNPYFAVTDLHGEYEIANVPPGKYRVKIWHELLGTQVSSVVVTAGKTSERNFKLASDQPSLH